MTSWLRSAIDHWLRPVESHRVQFPAWCDCPRKSVQHNAVRLFAALLLGTALLVAAGCKEAQQTVYPPLRVGAYYWPGMYWVDIAHQQGWFREAGLNIEWVDTNPNYFQSFDNLFAGKLDIVSFTQFDFILYNARGQRLVAILASDYSNGAEALVARPGINSVRELAGNKLALSKGTYLDYIWAIVAQRNGLDPEAVHIVDTPGESAHELLARGEVDAILTWEPFVTQGLDAVQGSRLFDSSQISGLSWGLYAVRPELLEQRRVELQKFLEVWLRATEFIRRHPEQAYAIVAEVNGKTPAEVRDLATKDRILDLRDNLTAFSFAAGFESLHGATRQMNDFIAQRGIATGEPDTARLFDSHFVGNLTLTDTKQ